MKKILLLLLVFVFVFSVQSCAQNVEDASNNQEKIEWTKEEQAIAEKVDEKLRLSSLIDNYYGKKGIKLSDDQKKRVNLIAQEEMKSWISNSENSLNGFSKEELKNENKKLRKTIIKKTNQDILTTDQRKQLTEAKAKAKEEKK